MVIDIANFARSAARRAALASACAAIAHGARQFARDRKRRYIGRAAAEWPMRREAMLIKLGLEGRSHKRVALELREMLRDGGFPVPLARWVIVGALTGELRMIRAERKSAAEIAAIFKHNASRGALADMKRLAEVRS